MIITTKYKEPEDIEFMHQCAEIDKNKPFTWLRYPNDKVGANSIIKMEFEELMNTKDKEAYIHELYHLATACLHAWRVCK